MCRKQSYTSPPFPQVRPDPPSPSDQHEGRQHRGRGRHGVAEPALSQGGDTSMLLFYEFHGSKFWWRPFFLNQLTPLPNRAPLRTLQDLQRERGFPPSPRCPRCPSPAREVPAPRFLYLNVNIRYWYFVIRRGEACPGSIPLWSLLSTGTGARGRRPTKHIEKTEMWFIFDVLIWHEIQLLYPMCVDCW